MFSLYKKRPALAEVTILFGTHSGHSKYVARQLAKLLDLKGVSHRVLNMKRFRAADLVQERCVLMVVSTHGDGEPPAGAMRFVTELSKVPELSGLQYSVCALGDSYYENFCETGRYIDAVMMRLGARALVPRVDCDEEFEMPAARWIKEVAGVLSGSVAEEVSLVSQTRRYKARLTRQFRLNQPDSSKEVFHLEFESDLFPYLPGDSVGFIPSGFPNGRDQQGRTPRYYSIASSPLEVTNGFHLTVKTHEKGLCSPCLNHLLRPGDELEFIHLPSESFRLGHDHPAIILVAAGVGIAPFRAFIRHNAAQLNPVKIWLLYGDRNIETDYLYRDEWKALLEKGSIHRMDVAFSRNDPPQYVQDLLRINRKDVAQWVQSGTAVYVCGSKPMGAAVRGFFDDLSQNLALGDKGVHDRAELAYYEELF
ncbi:flavodoxin domain-containing protein [Geofilum rubicundum]|uniref:Sulfite reductase [NADPH] flavoprotein alpha-component n=1 Tax=Geofilum rubicundum JCM 15548 TaxID=1236989 RepID=A0A0E9LZJ9_9BACT|nr:sulfite reductase flavoprotein subunit alpha [Geofilum rubicundum]GAO30733.1 sulfite reductase [NADPH] flavoprotein alpha-component [Geofilum rubicundum JCM 15548]